jgi:hypothetical protein
MSFFPSLSPSLRSKGTEKAALSSYIIDILNPELLTKDLVSEAPKWHLCLRFLFSSFEMQQMEQLSNEKRSKFNNSFEARVCLRFSPFRV